MKIMSQQLQRVCSFMIVSVITIANSGCFPVVATGMFATAVAVTDRRTPGIILEDETIELKSIQRISAEFSKSSVSVSVTSVNRIALITGWVPNEGVSKKISALVADIENVRDVFNEVNIGPVTTTKTFAKDAILTTKVKASLIDEKNLNGNVIKVKTENGVVFLLGLVTKREADLAADIASRIDGTRRVVKVFDYITEEELTNLQSRLKKTE